MKISLQSSKNNIGWQAERARILQRSCKTIKLALRGGDKIGRAIKRLSRRHNGRPYKCDPSRRLALSPKTLRRIWDGWRHSGESTAAFQLNFYRRPSAMTSPVLKRFAHFCAIRRHKSFRAAWLKFIKLRGAMKGKSGVTVSYDMALHNFGAARFYLLQAKLKALYTTQAELANLRRQTVREIAQRFPVRRKGRR